MRDICELIDEEQKYYIYGTTTFAQYCSDKLTERFGDDIVLGFMETEPKREMFRNKRVISIKDGNKSNRVIIAGFNSSSIMKNNLLELGYDEDKIIIPEGFKNYFISDEDIHIKNVCFWPPIKEFNKDLTDKIAWFLPDRINVNVWTEDEETIQAFNENVKVCNIADVNRIMDEADCICIWDVFNDDNIGEKYDGKIKVVDPEFYVAIDLFRNYVKFYYMSFSKEEQAKLKQHSSDVFKEMKEKAKMCNKTNVFCTGPSIEEIYDKDYKDEFNIICNSMVKDKEFLSNLKPDLITFIDAAFYVSPNDYCKAFYSDLLEGYRKYAYYMAVMIYEVPLITKHFPELYDKILGIEQLYTNEVIFPNEFKLEVMRVDNICTGLMLPIASEISEVIGIAGCTGRNPDETYYWKHNGRAQYLDLMQHVFDAYPSFFRDVRYKNYYDEHCEYFRKIVEYGEKMGKKYINMTTSFIPVLKERTGEI